MYPFNIETLRKKFHKLYAKDYLRMDPSMKLISELTAKTPLQQVRQATPFIVGASDETDQEL